MLNVQPPTLAHFMSKVITKHSSALYIGMANAPILNLQDFSFILFLVLPKRHISALSVYIQLHIIITIKKAKRIKALSEALGV